MVQMEPLLATRPKAASKVSMNFTIGRGLGALLLHSHLPTQQDVSSGMHYGPKGEPTSGVPHLLCPGETIAAHKTYMLMMRSHSLLV